MPIYEYRCTACGGYLCVLVRGFSNPEGLRCPRCHGDRMRKLVSRFAVLHSDDDRLERMADPGALGDVDENDPRSVARWARRMGEEVGEDLGDEFHEMVDRMEAGELPDDGAGEDGMPNGPGDAASDPLD